MNIVKKILALLTVPEKRYLAVLLMVMIASAAFEVVGIASIMPFMALLADPHVAETSQIFKKMAEILGTKDTLQLQQAAGVVTLVFLLLSNSMALLTNWMSLRFTHGIGHVLATRLLTSYMQQPYEFFLSRNAVELGKNILSEVQRVMTAILIPALQMTARFWVALAITSLLIFVNPTLAISTAAAIGIFYTLLYVAIRRRLNAYGRMATKAGEIRFKTASDALSGIKEIKIAGREDTFLKKFIDASYTQTANSATAESLSLCPKYLLEIMAFGGIVVLSLVLLHTQHTPQRILPILALYAFAGYRLMPAMQQIYYALTMIRFHHSALDILHKDLNLLPQVVKTESSAGASPAFTREFKANALSYSYPNGNEVLRNISLTVPRNATIGLAGKSGAGKTTLVDIFLGLLPPTSGTLEVDGQKISGDVRGWQSLLGYVPQHIYLTDDSIAANIALGVPAELIDQVKLERAAKLAHLHDFITGLPEGYKTSVGDRGIRLSGGQRQRIGIARALYADPPILIMDEATSALDNVTESAVMEAIRELSGKKTIIIIAHRLTTLRSCQKIYVLDQGRIAAQGRYDELMEQNPAFRALALTLQEQAA